MRLIQILGLLCAAVSTPALAAPAAGPSLSIDGAWARESTVRDKVDFVYMTISLNGRGSDRLLAVSTPFAESVQLWAPEEAAPAAPASSIAATAALAVATATVSPAPPAPAADPAASGPLSLHPADAVILNPQAPTVMQPLGLHFILKGVRHHLDPGSSFVMTLAFEKTGSREIAVKMVTKPPESGMPAFPKDLKLD